MAIENAEQARALVQRLESDNIKNTEKIAAQDGEIAALKRTVAELAQERAERGQVVRVPPPGGGR